MKRSALYHTKTTRLMARLKLPRYAAVGLLETLWHLTAREAPTGDIGKLDNETIAMALEYPDADKMIEALIDCRWIDRSDTHRLVIHDWHDHADEAVKKALKRSNEDFAVGKSPDMNAKNNELSGNVETCRDKSSLPVPVPVPVPVPSPAPPVPTGVAGLLARAGVRKDKIAEILRERPSLTSANVLAVWGVVASDPSVKSRGAVLASRLLSGEVIPTIVPKTLAAAIEAKLVESIGLNGDRNPMKGKVITHNSDGLYLDRVLAYPAAKLPDLEYA